MTTWDYDLKYKRIASQTIKNRVSNIRHSNQQQMVGDGLNKREDVEHA
jgi:hypothetical protein